MNTSICTLCGQNGHSASKCPWGVECLVNGQIEHRRIDDIVMGEVFPVLNPGERCMTKTNGQIIIMSENDKYER